MQNNLRLDDKVFDEIDGQYKELLNAIKDNGNKVIIVGAGKRGKEFAGVFQSHNIEVLLFMDNDKNKWNTMICDVSIRPLQKVDMDVMYFVSVYSDIHNKVIRNQLLDMGIAEDSIFFSSYELSELSEIECKKQRFKEVHNKIKFEEWHLSVIEERPYALYCIQLINSIQMHKTVVEIGCGVGDLLSKIKSEYKRGYDVSYKVIEAGRQLFPQLELEVGSFNTVKEKNIDVLIAVNFMHRLEENVLLYNFQCMLRNSYVKYILVDFVESMAYKYNHDYNRLFGLLGYKLVHESRRFETINGYRKICLFEFFQFEK